MGAAHLVSTQWLQEHLEAPGLRVLDCTTYMTPQPIGASLITSGRPHWLAARIPGSVHVCMVDDLSDPQGRFPYTLPSAAALGRRLARLGLSPNQHLVLYGAAHPMVVSRAWWVLTALGWPQVSVLDGGWAAWEAEKRPIDRTPMASDAERNAASDAAPDRALQSGSPAVASAADPASSPEKVLGAGRCVDAQGVAQAMDRGSAWLVNALSTEQFAGTGGSHYGRPGRIPGSLSLPARDLVTADTARWLAPDQVRERAAQAGLVNDGRPVIVYCGGGIAATATAFALERAGWSEVKVYDNSLLEWSADPARPMLTDSTTG